MIIIKFILLRFIVISKIINKCMIAISIAGTGNGLFIAMIGLYRIDDSAHGNAHRIVKLSFLAENF